MFEFLSKPTPLNPIVRVMLVVWCVLLVPWLMVVPGAGMAFDAGYTTAAYLVACDILTYPVAVGISFYYRRRHPRLIWLPILNFILPAVAALDEIRRTFSN